MKNPMDERCTIDDLAEQADGYFAVPTQEEIAYADLLFDVCARFSIRYYSGTKRAPLC